MDTSDSNITFDSDGVCDHCYDFKKNILPKWDYGKDEEGYLDKKISEIKKLGKNKDFDCILGMSGGADSSYLLHKVVKDFDLRPLVFHVDGGWNSEIAVNNINVMINKLNLDLFTEVINWEEMKAFQLAYFKSSLPNIDVPQDHAFISTLYNYCLKFDIKHILNGGNISTECVRNPLEWIYYGTDMAQINHLLRLYCPAKLNTYPFSSVFRHKIYLKYIRGVNVIKPLNYMTYIKEDAMKFLEKEYSWKPYPQKHFESRFTKFYEGYWLPKKFGFDTRKVQFSSMILTNQMTREEALEELKKPAITEESVQDEFEYIANKLEISVQELESYLNSPNKTFRDYKNSFYMFDLGAKALKMLGIETSIKR